MPSRQLQQQQKHKFISKTKILFITLTISASVIIIITLIYFLYHLYNSLVNRSKTVIPFDSCSPIKVQSFSYKELKSATNDFDDANIIGRGGSGTVFRGIARDGKLLAIKRLDNLSLQIEREFQNELQIIGGLKSPFLVTLLGYCVEKNKRFLVYEYMPNKSLQGILFTEGENSGINWERRFDILLDVAKALEFLHCECNPPVIHGDIKPSNVLLDSFFRAKISDFGLSRIKAEGGEFGVDLFSQELSGNLRETPTVSTTPVEGNTEVDFSVALKALKNINESQNLRAFDSKEVGDFKGKQVSGSALDGEEFCSVEDKESRKQWGKDWWWRQDGSGELCSKDYVNEWIGSQIFPSANRDWDEEEDLKASIEKPEFPNSAPLQKSANESLGQQFKKPGKMQVCLKTKLKGFKKVCLHKKLNLRGRRNVFTEQNQNHCDMWSGDLFSRELSSTTSMRGTLCYVAPEYGGCGFLMEKADIYSFGVLILVIVSGRRPLHILSSPMKFEKANLISWCKQLAQTGNILELVDDKLKDEYNKEQSSLCIKLALSCLQKMPELRPDIRDVVRVLKGEIDLPTLPFEFSPSPPSKPLDRSRRKQIKSEKIGVGSSCIMD